MSGSRSKILVTAFKDPQDKYIEPPVELDLYAEASVVAIAENMLKDVETEDSKVVGTYQGNITVCGLRLEGN